MGEMVHRKGIILLFKCPHGVCTLHGRGTEDEGWWEGVAAAKLVPIRQGYARMQHGGSRLGYCLHEGTHTTVEYDLVTLQGG